MHHFTSIHEQGESTYTYMFVVDIRQVTQLNNICLVIQLTEQ